MNNATLDSNSNSSSEEEDWEDFVEFVPKDYTSLSRDEWYDILTSYEDNQIPKKDMLEMRMGLMEYIKKNSGKHGNDD